MYVTYPLNVIDRTDTTWHAVNCIIVGDNEELN